MVFDADRVPDFIGNVFFKRGSGMKWLPYILIVVAFAAGMLLKTSPDKELRKKWEDERRKLEESIKSRDARILILTGQGEAIKERMQQDSLQAVVALKGKDSRIKSLTNKLNEINLARADADSLDSIIARLYPD
jgi:hypothetical protein